MDNNKAILLGAGALALLAVGMSMSGQSPKGSTKPLSITATFGPGGALIATNEAGAQRVIGPHPSTGLSTEEWATSAISAIDEIIDPTGVFIVIRSSDKHLLATDALKAARVKLGPASTWRLSLRNAGDDAQ